MPTEFILKEQVTGNAANGTLYFDITGTSTPKPVYQDALKTIPWPYPIPLNAQGVPSGNVYLAGGGYRMTVRNANGAILPGYPNDAIGVADAPTEAPSFASLTNKPTTLGGYGITDAVSDADLAAISSGTQSSLYRLNTAVSTATLAAMLVIGGTPLAEPVAPIPIPDTDATLPAVGANGSTVLLAPNTAYLGTLDLRSKTNISVKKSASGIEPMIIPGVRTAGAWTAAGGGVYWTAMASAPLGVLAPSGRRLSESRWPAVGYIQSTGNAPTQTLVNTPTAVPNADVANAVMVVNTNEFSATRRTVVSATAGAITISATKINAVDGDLVMTNPKFYLTGKLWMLSEVGASNQWHYDAGTQRLYVRTADDAAPTNKFIAITGEWAVVGGSSCTLSQVDIKGGRYGWFAGQNVTVNNNASVNNKMAYCSVTECLYDGAYIGNTTGFTIKKCAFHNNFISGVNSYRRYGALEETVGTDIYMEDVLITESNYNQFDQSWGAVALKFSNGGKFIRVEINNSSGEAIYLGRNQTVYDMKVNGAALDFNDCAGIYTTGVAIGGGTTATNITFEKIAVKNVNGTSNYAVYFDDYSNAISVTDLDVESANTALLVHSGWNIDVYGVKFARIAKVVFKVSDNAVIVRPGYTLYNTDNVKIKNAQGTLMPGIGAGVNDKSWFIEIIRQASAPINSVVITDDHYVAGLNLAFTRYLLDNVLPAYTQTQYDIDTWKTASGYDTRTETDYIAPLRTMISSTPLPNPVVRGNIMTSTITFSGGVRAGSTFGYAIAGSGGLTDAQLVALGPMTSAKERSVDGGVTWSPHIVTVGSGLFTTFALPTGCTQVKLRVGIAASATATICKPVGQTGAGFTVVGAVTGDSGAVINP